MSTQQPVTASQVVATAVSRGIVLDGVTDYAVVTALAAELGTRFKNETIWKIVNAIKASAPMGEDDL